MSSTIHELLCLWNNTPNTPYSNWKLNKYLTAKIMTMNYNHWPVDLEAQCCPDILQFLSNSKIFNISFTTSYTITQLILFNFTSSCSTTNTVFSPKIYFKAQDPENFWRLGTQYLFLFILSFYQYHLVQRHRSKEVYV